MINATRKVKEKAEPELREAVKRGRIGVQDAARVGDLPVDQQKAIAASPTPRRAANVAIEEAKSAAALSASGEEEPRAALSQGLGKSDCPTSPMERGRQRNEGMVSGGSSSRSQ